MSDEADRGLKREADGAGLYSPKDGLGDGGLTSLSVSSVSHSPSSLPCNPPALVSPGFAPGSSSSELETTMISSTAGGLGSDIRGRLGSVGGDVDLETGLRLVPALASPMGGTALVGEIARSLRANRLGSRRLTEGWEAARTECEVDDTNERGREPEGVTSGRNGDLTWRGV
jgi:hypothetical protein